MAKINQIQNAIIELDGGAFQKLADSYLLRKDYSQINPLGSVAGSNKVRKGTPDTLIPTPDGKYVFAEYTTISKSKVLNKFTDDISKCLDESKTGIALAKIKEIVLCYTSDLSAKDIDTLREQCEAAEVNLNLFGLGSISYDLLEKHPSIAKDYLGIEVDTGQIVTLEHFVSLYEKNKLATTLQIPFYFREEEKNDLLTLIQDNSLVIVSGAPGVGKSRIAIECYDLFLKGNESYQAYCIFNQGLDLFEDVRAYFSDSGDYLIFVDDANRISGFQYILQLLQTKRSDQNYKIIVTVRDYALDKIRNDCKFLDSIAEISLNPFTDKEIKKLLQDEFEIRNNLYLDRIIDFSHGNPRIAVMAAKIAKESNTLESISDVSELYDSYYSSIKNDLDDLKNKNILKVAGIIAFFRIVDKTNETLMSDISEKFGISPEDFLETSKILHDMEILDMFENEVVKISDQVLATYLFYLVFFKEKLIDFSILINKLFPQFKQRLVDAINPILNTFNFEESKKTMESSVDMVWQSLQLKDESAFLQLIDVFWFLKPTDTLIFFQEKIEKLDTEELDIDNIEFDIDNKGALPEFLSTLSLFRFLGIDEVNISLELFFKYSKKQPHNTSKVLRCFIDKYGFQPDSHYYNYQLQHAVIDKLLEYCQSGKNEYYTRMFISLSGNYLRTHFSSSSLRGNQVTITEFDLSGTDSIFELRKKIVSSLLEFYKDKKFQLSILKVLSSHSLIRLNTTVSTIVEHDSKLIIDFFIEQLEPTDLYHCIIVQQYLTLLKRLKITFDKKLILTFKSSNYVIYHLFTNRVEQVELKLSHNKYKEYIKKKIAEFATSYSKDEYAKLLHELFHILLTIDGHSKWEINQGIFLMLEELGERDPILFSEVIKNYLEQGDYLEINPWVPVSSLIQLCGGVTAFNIISTPDYSSKNRWMFSYYQQLPKGEIRAEQIDALFELYQTSEHQYFVNDNDYLLKYESVKKGFVVKMVQIILKRAVTFPEYAHSLALMFNKHTDISKRLVLLFPNSTILLEDAYLAVDKIEPHSDYDGSIFSDLLDNNQKFINRYLEDKFLSKEYLGHYGDNRDYSFFWLRSDYLKVMQQISKIIFKYYQEGRCYDYYKSFFSKNNNAQTNELIIDRQDMFLLGEIGSNFANKEFIYFLFSVIAEFKFERKLNCYKLFLDNNKNIDEFKNLPFEEMCSGWTGSEVPMLQEKIDLYERLISNCSSIEFLKHRLFLEQRVQDIRLKILHAKKRDFSEEW